MDDEMTERVIADLFPGWETITGTADRLVHARLRNMPHIMVSGEDWTDLADQMRREDARLAARSGCAAVRDAGRGGLRTVESAEMEALEAEFPPWQVWTDFRPRDDGAPHWHARLPGWSAGQIISVFSGAEMRDRLIMETRREAAEVKQ